MTLLARIALLIGLLIAAPAFGQETSPRQSDPTCIRDDATATLSVTDGSRTFMRCNARGAQWVDLETRLDATNDSIAPGSTATTTYALSTCYATSAASNNSTNCKSSAGNLYGISVINTTTTIYYLRLYNLASAPTCSSATGFVETVPILPLPSGGTGVAYLRSVTAGQAFSTGLGFCITGGGGSTDNTSAATGIYLTLLYK